jgi:Icc-related predicted phosphoesterase
MIKKDFMKALITSDLHGSQRKYKFLFDKIRLFQPEAVFIGGDLTGFAAKLNTYTSIKNFYRDYLELELEKLKFDLEKNYPEIFIIMGNDDPINQEDELERLSELGLIRYVNERIVQFKGYFVAGYSYVPPTPFMNKDWEKYDVSQFVDVGCVSPEAGFRSIPVDVHDLRFNTIKRDLNKMFYKLDLSNMICLFHSPPYQTNLDRAALDGIMVNHAPMDVHVGSIAIKEFIVNKSPYITLHGHIHESTRITGKWKEKIGDTICLQGAYEHNQNAIILFDLENPEDAELITQIKKA